MPPRRRKYNRDLPPRVYRHHGHYRFVPPTGKPVNLGKDKAAALKKWAELMGEPSGRAMAALFDRYEKDAVPGKAPATRKSDAAALKPLRAVFDLMDPAEVRPMDVAAYLDLRGKKAPVRANREKALLSHVFTMAMRWGICDANPCRGVHRNLERPRRRYVTDAELATVRNLANPTLQCVLDFAYLTGLRRADILGLKLSDLTDAGITVTAQKTGKPAVITWSDELRELVERAKRIPRRVASVYLLSNRDGRHLEGSINSMWTRLMSKASAVGVARFQLKDVRAKHATDFDQAGGDASRNLDHSNPATTRRHYLRKPAVITPLKK